MPVHVYVFLLVVCLLLSLALLWRHDWLHLQPCSSRGAKRSTFHRLLKPRCPDDCPACRLASTPASGGGLASTPVRPRGEVKSRRGAPKRIHTDGFACPNPQCMYFGITDAHIHALVGDGKHGRAEQIQTFRCQACRTTFSARRHTPLYRLKTPAQSISPTSNWTNSAPGCTVPHRSSGCGWPSIPSPRSSLCFSSVRVHNTWPTY